MGAEDGRNFGRRLSTWKEIAGYFGRDERTVKRWETSRGLPVRRMPNGTRSTVYAYEHELRAWLDEAGPAEEAAPANATEIAPAAPTRPSWPSHLYMVAATVCAVVLGCLTFLRADFLPHPGPLATIAPSRAQHVPNAEAASFYRAGLYEWQTRTPAGLTHAVDDFTQAIIRDPLYAEAYVGLANCYNLLREFSNMPSEEAFPRAKAAAERAIALDPTLANAHAALAFTDFYWSRDTQGARREFERAIALEPRNATAHHWYATFLLATGNAPRALKEIGKAQALDSESTAILADKGLILFAAGQHQEAIALLNRLEQTEPAFFSPHFYLANMYLEAGDNAGFLREFRTASLARHDETGAALAVAGARGLAAAGRRGMFQAILDEQKQLFAAGKISAYGLALSYARLDDEADAITYLKLSLSRHETDNVTLGLESAFTRLRTRADWPGLMQQAGYPVRS